MALRKKHLANDLYTVQTGDEALRFLRRQGGHADAPRPGIILLDINLPGISGHDVLHEIKQDQALRAIPVVMLTSSDAPRDIEAAYGGHANSYIVKPVDFHKFVDAVAQMTDYWFELVARPDA